MSKKPSVKSSELSLMSVPAFWPMAMAAAMMEEGTELYAKNLKFAEEEIKIHDELRPKLATQIKFASTCGPWCCAITASRAGFLRSSMLPMPVTRL